MAWTALSRTASGSQKTSGSSISKYVANTANAGEVVVVCVGCDNVSTGNGDLGDIVSVTDTQSNTYTKVRQRTNGNGTAAAGAACAVYVSKLTTTLVALTDIITANFSVAVTASALTAWTFSVSAGAVISTAGSADGTVEDATTAPTATISGLASQEYLWVSVVAVEGPGPAGDDYTKDIDYTVFDRVGTTGGADDTNLTTNGEYRIFSGTTDTNAPTLTPARDLAQVFAALKATVTSATRGRLAWAEHEVPLGTLPIIPGATGFGITTRAAYGGGSNPTVYRITTLADDATNVSNADGTINASLRAALQATGPRVVIFERSGTITLNSNLSVTSPYLTVEGATAPSPGITIRNYPIIIRTHNVFLHHLRLRTGDQPPPPIPDKDALTTYKQVTADDVHDIVYDHLSMSWALDENFGHSYCWPPQNRQLTLNNSIMAEGLRLAAHSKNLLLADNNDNVSFLRNILMSSDDRNYYAKGNTTSYFANNLIYNWGTEKEATVIADPDSSGRALATVRGNVYRRGPNTPTPAWQVAVRYLPTGSQLYLDDNLADGADINAFTVIAGQGIDPRVGSEPVTVSGYSVQASSAVIAWVKANAGARPRDRDAVDSRLMDEITARTGQIPNSQDDVAGGYPVLAQNTRSLTLPANPHVDAGSGYTNLEVWLQGYAAGVEKYPTRGQVAWAEAEIPNAAASTPTRGRVSWAEAQVPLVPTRGRVSWYLLETPSYGQPVPPPHATGRGDTTPTCTQPRIHTAGYVWPTASNARWWWDETGAYPK